MSNRTEQQRNCLRYFLGFVAALSLATLMGCAQVPTKPPTGPTADAGHGIVLVRITSAGLQKMYAFVAKARPVGGHEQIFFSGWDMKSDGYWTVVADHLDKGQLVALQVPAGEYEFFNFQATSVVLGGTKTSTPTKTFSYRFTVVPGETTYLGELHFKFNDHTNVFSGKPGADMPLKISVRDTHVRDYPEAMKKIPGLTAEQIVVRLLH